MKRIAIIGAGKGGYALLNLLLDVKSIKVVGIADKNKNAPALKLANHHNIFTTNDYNELLKIRGKIGTATIFLLTSTVIFEYILCHAENRKTSSYGLSTSCLSAWEL